jgi:outer membrane receptor protein involved in Fe transport
MVNLGKVEIIGLDLALQGSWSFSEAINLDVSANGTFQKGLDKRVESNQFGHDIPYSPRVSGSLNADFNYGAWTISTSSQYTGNRYGSFHNLPSNYMEPWFLQDMGISYKWKWNTNSIRLKADINNLANTDYVILENYPMPGRNYRLGVQIQF